MNYEMCTKNNDFLMNLVNDCEDAKPIKKKYHGITHRLTDAMLNDRKFCEKLKERVCSSGVHYFDEVLSLEDHYLHCDICGLEVHINKIVVND